MNDSMSLGDLKNMLGACEWPCVSVFMPTHAAAPDNRGDQLQLKSLLKSAEPLLAARGMKPAEATALLAPARELAEDGMFWRPRPGGIAVFLSASGMRVARTAHAPAPSVTVNGRFRVRPVLPSIDRGERFFVLALSQHMVRLYRGDRDALVEIDLGDMPHDIAEALRNDGFDEGLQMHSSGGAPTGGGRGAAMFHGSGPDTGITTRYLTEYMKRVAAGLRDLVHDREAPLVLATVSELAAMYREADREHAIPARIVAGNPEPLSVADMHAQAWAVASEAFDAERDTDLAKYRELTGTSHVADTPDAVVSAAAYGRVAALLVDPAAEVWGAFDRASGEVEIHAEARPDSEDLVDHAAADTIVNGGSVHLVEELGAPVAAVLRY